MANDADRLEINKKGKNSSVISISMEFFSSSTCLYFEIWFSKTIGRFLIRGYLKKKKKKKIIRQEDLKRSR